LLIVGNDNKLYYKYDFTKDPILLNNTSISQIVFNDGKFFILSQDKTLYSLILQSDSTLNNEILSSETSAVINYFHVDNSSLQQLNSVYVGLSNSQNFIYTDATVNSNYDISTVLQYKNTIKHISKYDYFYNTLWDYTQDDEVLSSLSTSYTVNNSNGISTILSSGHSFTKNIYIIHDSDNMLCIMDYSTQAQLCSQTQLCSFTIDNVKGIYQLYDFSISATEYGEHLNDIYTYIFQTNQIQIGQF
jgi:hypothetical protein